MYSFIGLGAQQKQKESFLGWNEYGKEFLLLVSDSVSAEILPDTLRPFGPWAFTEVCPC